MIRADCAAGRERVRTRRDDDHDVRREGGLGRPSVRVSAPVRLAVSWLLATLALLVAAWIVPGAAVKSFRGAFVAAAVIAILNAILPPVIAALRLPLMLVTGSCSC